MAGFSATAWELVLLALGFLGFRAAKERPSDGGVPRPEPPKRPAEAESKRQVNPTAEVIDDLRAEGVNAANAAGSGRPNSAVQARLRRSAAARVATLHRGPFDPALSGDDAALQELLEDGRRTVARREETVERLKVQESRQRAAVVAPERRPRPPQLVMALCVLANAVGVSASLSALPVFAQIADDDALLSFLITVSIGLIFGAIAVVAQFDLHPLSADESPTRTSTDKSSWPTVGGLAMILAFGLIRIAAALTTETTTQFAQECLVTLGLVVLDLCVLAYTKVASQRHLARMDAWIARQADRPQFVKARDDTRALLATAEWDLESDRIATRTTERRREARELLNFDKELVAAWAGDEAVAAYLRRVDEIAAGQDLGR